MSFVRSLVTLASACALSVACAHQPTGRFPVEEIPVPDAVGAYTTTAQPEDAASLEPINSEIAAALAARGDRAELDGALSATAAWALREVNQRRPIDTVALETAARHYGFTGMLGSVAVFTMDSQDQWRDAIARAPRNLPITRYGIRKSPSGRVAAVLFGRNEANYQSIPRALEPGQSVQLTGEVAARFTFCHVYLTKPDGTVAEKNLPSRSFDATFELTQPGKYQLEVMGDGASGPVIASNVPLYVGVPEPDVTSTVSAQVDPEESEARMFTLLNQARAAAGLAPVVQDAELRRVALAHSEDMAEHAFFGHVSPSTGTAADRMHRAGILVSIFGENVAQAHSPEQAHDGLMNSPGHRANMLRAEFTHVGIGAAKSRDGQLLATLEFGRRPPASELPTSAAQIEAALVDLRARKGVPAASADPVYRAGAQAGADAMANGSDPSDVSKAIQSAMQKEVQRLRSSRPGGCVVSVNLLELRQLEEVPDLALPGVRRFGVGARVHHESRGTSLSTVFMLEGADCR